MMDQLPGHSIPPDITPLDFLSENSFRNSMHLKFSVVNLADSSWNTFSKQMSNSMHQTFVEITERLFKKAVPIHFVNYLTTNNILWS